LYALFEEVHFGKWISKKSFIFVTLSDLMFFPSSLIEIL